MASVNISYDAGLNIIANGYLDAEGAPYVYNLGNMAWVLTSTALVWFMVPGLGFFYAGLLRRKNALSMIYLSLAGLAVASFQWFFWGYSLAFSSTASPFIGDLQHIVLRNVLDAPSIGSTAVPASLYMVYQGMFAAITPVIALGGFAERARLGPALVFVFVWLTLVYCPIACWTWNSAGWGFILGDLDFAGGGPVHISSGVATFAISLYLGKRRGYGTERLAYKPHNTSYVVLGTVMLWFGWFGFNGGSALAANLKAVNAMIVTNLAASVGGLTWLVLDYRLERKWSAVGFCSGAISGLVGITPAAGYVGPPASIAIGFVTAIVCNFATGFKFLVGVDDALDVFATHGVGGFMGAILTALFAQASIAGLDGTTVIPGGWINQNYIQLGYQLACATAQVGYSFVMTSIILWLMHFVPFGVLRLRCHDEAEIIGIDDAEMGEYCYDYVGLDPEARLVHYAGHPTAVSGDDSKPVRASLPEESSGEESTFAGRPAVGNGNEKVGGGRVDP